MSLSRPTASRFTWRISYAAGICLGLLSFSAAPALAHKDMPAGAKEVQPVVAKEVKPVVAPVVQEAPATVSAALAVCPGQTFAQPFSTLGDANYYTLVEGSEFNSPSAGWELLGGAHVISTTRPDGSAGSALDLPSGSAAISPPVCVTLQYPTARMFTKTVQGKSNVVVSVAYANTRTASRPKKVGAIEEEETARNGKEASTWTLSAPFDVRPELGGKVEETRQVRFIFAAGGKGGDTQLYGLYVDPRMR